ncbi:hypothetical protein [Streptomyces europaeiscabiei]|uniref:hypothetical protein n=1 Tax=Streptomyces europaeiscabiei TaxID=146819 RepID=UPI0029B7FB02|nr:hypothetical protein [Streptomyces europaeiscabiei]MDX3839556.1 hypothetical protein [Streptomyces europaeiscabiei]
MVFHQTIVRVRAGTRTDRGGNTVPDWAAYKVSRLPVSQVSVQPATQAEDNDATRSQVVTGWQVISAPGVDADIQAKDRIEWDGMTLEVIGEVGRYLDFGDGSTHHIEFVMRRATG